MTTPHPAPHGSGTPRGHGDATEEVSQVGIEMLTKLFRGKKVNGPEHALAIAIKDDPVREAMAKTAARLGVEAVITVVGAALTALFPSMDTTRVLNMVERVLTGSAFGDIDRLTEMSEEDLTAALQREVKHTAAGHTAAVAAGVPKAKRYVWIDGPAAYCTSRFYEVAFRADETIDFRPARPDVIDDVQVPYTVGGDEFGRMVDLYFEENAARTDEIVEESGGGKPTVGGKPPGKMTKRTKRRVPADRQLRLRYGDELELEAKIARGEILPHPSITDWHERVRAARAAAHATPAGAHGHGDVHAPAAPAAPRKSLLQHAIEVECLQVVRVVNGIARATLNPGQAILKDDFYEDIQRDGISPDLLKALDAFCVDMADPLTSENIDHFFNWLDDNVPGVKKNVASTWREWFWQQRRNAARYWGYALLGVMIALAIAAGLVALALAFLGPVYKFFLDGFAAAGVDIVKPGKWAYETMAQMFNDMMGASIASITLVDPVLANLLKVEGTVFLLGVLCTIISVWGQWLLIRFRFAPEGDERFRNVGRDCVLFLVELAALYAILIMFWIPTGWALGAVVPLMFISVGARMAYRSQTGMEATIRDNLRQTHQFLMFRLSAVFVVQVILRFVFPTELTLLHTQLTAFIGTNGLTFLAAVMLAGGWAALTMRSTATPAERASYNTALSYVLALVLLITFAPPVWGEVKNTTSSVYQGVTESAARGWTHFLNPSDSWSKAPSSGVKTSTTPSAAPAKVAVPALPVPSVSVQAPPAHPPAPAAAPTPINPALKRFCDSLGPVQRSQTTACKGI